MTPEELKQTKDALNMFRGNRVLAVSITYERWMSETTLGLLHSRSTATQELDQALREYYQKSKTEASSLKRYRSSMTV